jgi:hypothetical protein
VEQDAVERKAFSLDAECGIGYGKKEGKIGTTPKHPDR